MLAHAARVALAMLVLTAARSAALTPLGPEQRLEEPTGIVADCGYLEGRGDGTFAELWLRYAAATDLSVLARAGDVSGALYPIRRLDGSPVGGQPQGIATDAEGFHALWRRAYVNPGSVRYTHTAVGIGLDGLPREEPRELGRGGATRMSPRPGGGFVANWQMGTRLFVQLVAAEGFSLGKAYKIDAGLLNNVNDSVVAHSADGRFVVLWSGWHRRGRGYRYDGVWAQRFDVAGKPLTKMRQLLPPPSSRSGRWIVRAALGADGHLAIAGAVYPNHGLLPPTGVTLFLFGAKDAPLGRFEATPESIASRPESVAIDADGHLLLLWQQHTDMNFPQVIGRLFARDATPLGEPFDLSSADNPEQYEDCARAAWAGSAWVVTWMAWSGAPYGEGSTLGRFVRRFAAE
jgi:hypothetical protein